LTLNTNQSINRDLHLKLQFVDICRDSGGHHDAGYNVTHKYSSNVDRLSGN